jgi:hypothetical protein
MLFAALSHFLPAAFLACCSSTHGERKPVQMLCCQTVVSMLELLTTLWWPAGDPVPGGFYMGADYVKYTTPMATSLSLLAYSLVEHKEGYKSTVS